MEFLGIMRQLLSRWRVKLVAFQLEFITLGSKQYGLLTADDEDLKKVKGVKRNVIKRKITLDDYKIVLFDDAVERRDPMTI